MPSIIYYLSIKIQKTANDNNKTIENLLLFLKEIISKINIVLASYKEITVENKWKLILSFEFNSVSQDHFFTTYCKINYKHQ